MFEKIIDNVHIKKPIVHNITNYVTVNDCANIILSSGASPIMADDIDEVEEIVSICNALVINIGTLNERTIKSMIKAGKKANELNIPVILDPVGVGASTLRTKTIHKLIKNIKFAVIKGNISEIKAINDGIGATSGVDANEDDVLNVDNVQEAINIAKSLAKKTNSVVAITSAIDIVTNEKESYVIKNGHPYMAKITGSGCMLGALIGSYCGANEDYLLATTCAVSLVGISGEKAYEQLKKYELGNSSYRNLLIDNVGTMTRDAFIGGMKIEHR